MICASSVDLAEVRNQPFHSLTSLRMRNRPYEDLRSNQSTTFGNLDVRQVIEQVCHIFFFVRTWESFGLLFTARGEPLWNTKSERGTLFGAGKESPLDVGPRYTAVCILNVQRTTRANMETLRARAADLLNSSVRDVLSGSTHSRSVLPSVI